ncbi:hypothetical protein LCGC14_1937670 [marine sediment metagenome]|uniref:Uncharacterized protein n=1 Tax=marine sediment metagenome TaxID=412755 RepID=A0A0F9HZR4_9ZZZZ
MTETEKYIAEMEDLILDNYCKDEYDIPENEMDAKEIVSKIIADTKKACKREADKHRMAKCLQLTDEQLSISKKP